MKKNFSKNSKKGFTLIEVVVAVGLFSIVMMVALAIILSVVDNNKKVHSVNVVVDNLNFAIDSMVRDIKTGKHYRCGITSIINIPDAENCTGSQNNKSITLVSTLYAEDKIVQYEFDEEGGKIIKRSCEINSQASTESQKVCLVGSFETADLTSSEIDITDVRFKVNPGSPGSVQPTVFLLIKGTSAVNPTEASDFIIQTLISQRYLNI